MKIVFAGTPEFAVPCLQKLLSGKHNLAAVYTQPDRPAGRGRIVRVSPVKQLAERRGLIVCQPPTLRDDRQRDALVELAPDLMVVVAYGLLLPPEVLAIPKRGCVNVHASLLPRWRGAAPIQRALLAGDSKTGVTLMQMDSGLDTGGILAQVECTISATATAADLHNLLATLGADLLGQRLEELLAGILPPRPQDESRATYAGKLNKAEACLDWNLDAETLGRRVRAFNPWPVAYTDFAGRQLRIWRADTLTGPVSVSPGTVVDTGSSGIDVACGQGILRLIEVQLPGRRRLAAAEFIHAHPLRGTRFGSVASV